MISSPLKIALVGRPNVGKSALFNSLCGERISIVDAAEGVTRDRVYGQAHLFGHPLLLIDTAGIDPYAQEPFSAQVRRQTQKAIEEADSLIMVVDVTAGVTELDREVAALLRRSGKPVALAVNKVDDPAWGWSLWQFASLAIEPMIATSALHRWQLAELVEPLLVGRTPSHQQPPVLKPAAEGTEAQQADILEPKVAVVGRPNVGKSSLLNYLLDEERCVVSEMPGTTRDAIDLPLLHEGRPYLFIDTAGIRRKKAEKEAVDKFAAIRTEEAIARTHLCLLMIDSELGITTQEKRIAREIEDQGRGCILLLNKWDLVKGFRMEHCLREAQEQLPFLRHCPKLFISALTGRNVDKLFPQIDLVAANYFRRITTHQLNAFLEKAMQASHPPMIGGRRLRVYYMSQVEVAPPTFVLFVNDPDLMSLSYQKYLLNQFRREYGFEGVPLRLLLRKRERRALPPTLLAARKRKNER